MKRTKILSLPKGDQWKNLPKTKNEAIKLGLNRFVPEDGQLREIRRFGSERYPNGKVELWGSRSENRGGKSDGSRAQNEALATPPWADKNKFNIAKSKANAQGLDADHIRTIARTANGIRWLESTGRGSRETLWKTYEEAGLPLGNQAGNIAAEDPYVNQQVVNNEYRQLDEGIARATGGFNVLDVFAQMNAWHKGKNAMRDVVSKAGKRVLTNGVPGAGTVSAGINANTRLNEFKQQPNIQNGVQLGASLFETGANGLSDFALATGIGAPLAAPAEAIANGAGLVDEVIDASEQLMGR